MLIEARSDMLNVDNIILLMFMILLIMLMIVSMMSVLIILIIMMLTIILMIFIKPKRQCGHANLDYIRTLASAWVSPSDMIINVNAIHGYIALKGFTSLLSHL